MKKLIAILLASIMLTTFVTSVGAANNNAVPALNLNFEDVEWLFAIAIRELCDIRRSSALDYDKAKLE